MRLVVHVSDVVPSCHDQNNHAYVASGVRRGRHDPVVADQRAGHQLRLPRLHVPLSSRHRVELCTRVDGQGSRGVVHLLPVAPPGLGSGGVGTDGSTRLCGHPPPERLTLLCPKSPGRATDRPDQHITRTFARRRDLPDLDGHARGDAQRRSHRCRQAAPSGAETPALPRTQRRQGTQIEGAFTTVVLAAGAPTMVVRVMVSSPSPTRVASPRPNSSGASESARRPCPRRSRASRVRAWPAGNATSSTMTSGTSP